MDKIINNKLFKIGIAMILAGCLAFSVMLPAIVKASDLTITNTLEQRTYTAYRVLERSDDGVYSIKTTSGFFQTVYQWAVGTEEGVKSVKLEDQGTYYTFTINDEFTETVASKFAAYIVEHKAEWESQTEITKYVKVAESDSVVFTDVENGYYFVTSSAGTVASMVTVAGTGSINEKNTAGQLADISAALDKEAYELGELATLTTTTTFNEAFTVKSSGYFSVNIVSGYTYGLRTVLTNHALSNVYLDDTLLVKDTDYSVTSNEKYITITLKEGLNINLGSKVKVVTTGNVCYDNYVEGYEIASGYWSDMCISSKVQRVDGTVIDNTSTKFRTLRVDIVKTSDEDREHALAGAKFKIYRGTDTSTDPIEFYLCDTTDPALAPSYMVMAYPRTDEAGEFTKQGREYYDVGTEITLDFGATGLCGLGEGTYTAVETEAPNGYTKLVSPITITVGTSPQVSSWDAETVYNSKYLGGGIEVINYKGVIIPPTGGIGILIFVIIGACCVICSVAYSIYKKNKVKQNINMVS